MSPVVDPNMSEGHDDFDPERREEREIGREMVDKGTGLGSVAAICIAVKWTGPSTGAVVLTSPIQS